MAVLLPRGVEDYLRYRCKRDGMHMVFVLLSEMVKPNVPKPSKTAIIAPARAPTATRCTRRQHAISPE